MKQIKVTFVTHATLTLDKGEARDVSALAQMLLDDGRLHLRGQFDAQKDGPIVEGYFYAPHIVGIYEWRGTSTEN